MVLEYCEKGQLRDWLLQQKNASTVDTVELLFRIVYGIAKGMRYLETKKLVHRRLAARNVLLTGELEPKIYGFGPEPPQQQRNDSDGDVTSDEKERIPVKWTAPECLMSMKNASTKSDVWSFGIVLWEVFSLGETPYPGIRSRDVQTHVKNGHRMTKPEFANEFYHGIMRSCWNSKPKQRPSFKDISTDIGKTFNNAPSDEFYYYSEK
ncbi:megakaryocyte-associated tyrosine-protein kinase-like [Saccostrea cucullata]|uniref:megakaryocyte-associated tyrosine-protein kinase-like n=1 Tax=Saccostrea cuccullata TaxID=36930 RepID=UPI002ED2CDCD